VKLSEKNKIDVIFVPQGAEYQSVYRGLTLCKRSSSQNLPILVPIPIGVDSVTVFLEKWQQAQTIFNKPYRRALLLGLCGSLSPRYGVGDIVIYQNCQYDRTSLNCHATAIALLQDCLLGKAFMVKGLTCDRVVFSTQEKVNLAQIYHADAIDMESYAVLKLLSQMGIETGIVRVISDDLRYDLPDINPAIAPDGSLNFLILTTCMLQNPSAAMRLIRGSLKGLKVLKEVTQAIICS
jgi:hypothetical protein